MTTPSSVTAPPPAPDTLLVVAGEASGDQHGARVLRALSSQRSLRYVGVGGAAMEGEGLELLHPVSDLSVMGFVEVLPSLARVLRILRSVTEWAQRERPRLALLIDASDFNLRLARELWLLGIPVVYLIAPMAWAWRESRVRALRDLDRLLCIYPFEERFFQDRGVPATFVGNPLMDDPILSELPSRHVARETLGLPRDVPLVGLLPGSRGAEIRALLPLLMETAAGLQRREETIRFVIPIASAEAGAAIRASLPADGIEPILVEGRATEVFRAVDTAAVCSGTATLQAALALCPSVLVYKAHPLSMALAKAFVNLSHAGIANILQGKEIIPEFLQEEASPPALADALFGLLQDGSQREGMVAELRALRETLGGPGFGERVAAEILGLLPPAARV